MPSSAKDVLASLVQDFDAKNAMAFNESQARLTFIDKFWDALGWVDGG